jgi:hypothetical protein
MFSDPVIYDEVEKAVYEELWSQARMLTDSEFKSIKRSVFSPITFTYTHPLTNHIRLRSTL